MGFANLRRLSNIQLQQKIRTIAKDSASVFLTSHAKKRMKERKLPMSCVLDCLRFGEIQRPPVEHAAKGSLECRMERYVAGEHIAVICALTDEDPTALVVTVFYGS